MSTRIHDAPAATAGSLPLPPPPTIRGAVRSGAIELYYHLVRVVPVNLLFGVGLLAAIVAWAEVGPLPAAILGILLAIPVSGLATLAAEAARGGDLNLSDAIDPIRSRPAVVLGAGAGFLFAAIVLSANLVTGLLSLGVAGVGLATLAGWGLLGLFGLGLSFWPLLLDPCRADRPATAALRLAALLILAHPVRLGAFTILLVGVLIASTIAFAALLSISVGFVLFVSARYVLEAADRLERQLAVAGRPFAPAAPGQSSLSARCEPTE